MEPLFACLWICAVVTAATWLLSLATHEHSWVDRIWSIVPVAYLWVFAAASGLSNARLTLMAVLVTLWGARLTFNFARKGGYARGGEDYRWQVLRTRMKPWQFGVFNLLFISIYQNLILLLIALPALTAFEHRTTPVGPLDLLVAVVFLAFLAGETVADQQQWNFQQWKKTERAAGRDPRPRFVTTGLFRYSRHPNFFFEQAQWWALFLFGAVAAGSLWQWTVLGALLLTVLFVGSTAFTEQITRSRYPEYAHYQQATSPLVPWPPRRAAAVTG
jgi:steroid 5-alpha reductase family enzyme